MKQEERNKGIRKAMQESSSYKLPSNFTFRTMQKVEELARLKEKRQEQRMLFCIVFASLLLMAGSIYIPFYYFDTHLGDTFDELFSFSHTLKNFSIPTLWWSFPLVLLFFLTLDYWMRKLYDKYHDS